MIKPFLTYPILSRAVWGFSVEGSLQAMRMIMSGLFDEYPRLKIILGHLGEGIPYWLWRIDNRWMGEKDGIPGLFEADPIASKLQRKPSRYFKENFYIATSGMFWPPVLQFVCSVLGAERVLLAVDDYHSESIKEAIQSVELTSISDSDKEKICHLNAERLLKL
jgi:predicted TIM-barrel fold metal-dependent hydrolase